VYVEGVLSGEVSGAMRGQLTARKSLIIRRREEAEQDEKRDDLIDF